MLRPQRRQCRASRATGDLQAAGIRHHVGRRSVETLGATAPTSEWLAGPLAPDAWSGQVFVADHGDVFAFRFLSLPAKWMASAQVSRRGVLREAMAGVVNFKWPAWWRVVGPRAWDDSYARLIWQMPDADPKSLRMGAHRFQ